MEIQHHLEKIEKYERVIAKLDPLNDFELWMWAQMNSATNALNALLHHLGTTEPGTCFPHQIPGIFVEPEQKDGEWIKVIVPPGDIIHVGFPPLKKDIPGVLSPMLDELGVIEAYRETHVRGDASVSESMVVECKNAYDKCMQIARELFDQPQKESKQ